MRTARRIAIERDLIRTEVERTVERAGRVGLTDDGLVDRVRSWTSDRVIGARRGLSRDGVLLPIRAGRQVTAWRHRDHATEAERAEADRRPSTPPTLFGEGGEHG